MPSTNALAAILMRALVRPPLALAALRAAWRFRARGWWRHPPFLPLPPAEYMDWRLHTAYGEGGREPGAEEVERYLRWANRMYHDRVTRPRRR